MELTVYSNRHGHDDIYRIFKTVSGWEVKGLIAPKSGHCDKKGYPCLYDLLDHDLINYPHDLPGYMEWLWQKAEDGLPENEIQEALNDLGNWIKITEKNSPKGIFSDY